MTDDPKAEAKDDLSGDRGSVRQPNAVAIPVHIVTVGADEAELRRSSVMAEVVKPLSAQTFNSLEEIGTIESEKIPADAPVIVRLMGKTNTQVLAWIGSHGRVTTDAAILGFADGVIVDPSQPARAIGVLPAAFVSAIAWKKQPFDTAGAAILIGACDQTRAMAASLSRLGFKRLIIVDSDDAKSEQMVQVLRKRLFGVEIQAIPRATLTQLPNESSMAVNLVEASETMLLEDVSYLNFLKKNGVWIDWTNAADTLGYHDEILNAGAQLFSADLIRAWREVLLFEQVLGLKSDASVKSGGSAGPKAGFVPEELVATLHKAWSTASS